MTDKNPRLDPDGSLPKVPGWIALTEAGERLGYTRQHAFRLADQRKFTSLSRLGKSHTVCVSEEEVERMLASRTSGPQEPQTS